MLALYISYMVMYMCTCVYVQLSNMDFATTNRSEPVKHFCCVVAQPCCYIVMDNFLLDPMGLKRNTATAEWTIVTKPQP